jgi:Flp pilus assembly protein CpaB
MGRVGRAGGLPALVAAHRWSLTAGFAGLAAWCGLQALTPGPGPTVQVLIASRDLSWGSAIGRDDLTVVAFPAARVPSGALRDPAAAVGRWPTSAVRHGEPITDVRLLGTADPGGGPTDGSVAAPVRITDASAARMLRPGMVVDVLAAPGETFVPSQAPATVVAAGVRVLSVAGPDELSAAGGALVVLATTAATAARLATAESTGRLSITWHV